MGIVYIFKVVVVLFNIYVLLSLQSVSDDSVDLGSSSKCPSVLDNLGKAPHLQKEKKRQNSVPWWQEDEDSETQGKGRFSNVV